MFYQKNVPTLEEKQILWQEIFYDHRMAIIRPDLEDIAIKSGHKNCMEWLTVSGIFDHIKTLDKPTMMEIFNIWISGCQAGILLKK